MLKNYFLISIRNLARNKFSSLLNISGLAFGLASCLFIFLFVSDELSFDKRFKKSANIFRVQAWYLFEDVQDKFGITPFPVIPTLLKDYPWISEGARLVTLNKQFFKVNEVMYQQNNVYFADSNFFSIFDYPFLRGDPATSLLEPRSVILPVSEAKKIFGEEDALGKSIHWNKRDLIVTGVIDDSEINSHIEMGPVISLNSASPEFFKAMRDNWGNNLCYSYLAMKNEGEKEKLQEALDSLVAKYALPHWESAGFKGKIKMLAEPLAAIHFNNYLIYDTPKKGNLSFVWIFSAVAFITLVIACINFINMATASASRRAKEVGVRKVSGAGRSHLVWQFLSEAFVTVLIASVFALAIVEVFLPFFNQVTGKTVAAPELFAPASLSILIGLIAIISLLAGAYPAFFISRLPIQFILKDLKSLTGSTGIFRKTLVTFQFSISIFMIIATLSILSQLSYMRNKDLGFKHKNMVTLTLPAGDSTQLEKLNVLKTELRKIPSVKNVSRSANIPGTATSRYVVRVNTSAGKEDRPTPVMFTDASFMNMANVFLLQGRFFTDAEAQKPLSKLLVNEAAVKSFGWTDPLNEKIIMGGEEGEPEEIAEVVGVIRDFHFSSLHNPIEPLIIAQQDPKGVAGNLVVELEGNDPQVSLAAIDKEWKNVFPNKSFEYAFLDDIYRRMYIAEEKMFTIFTYFSLLAIVLSLLGLYALSFFTAQQRTKEAGIRKVLGASSTSILIMLNKDYLVLIFISILISFPLAWMGIGEWLKNFPYREEINPIYFVLAAIFTLVMTVAAVSVQAFSTAMQNPVKSLRYE